MVLHMKVNGSQTKDKEKESKFKQMALHMKVTGLQIKNKEKEK